MSGGSTPASGGTSDDPIRIGTLLYTLVEPHRGHQVAYNRWYERDHFYAGCMIGAYNFAGGRFVSTAPLKELRYPTAGGQIEPLVPDPQIGSYLALYYVLAGHHDEWSRWAVDQVNLLHASGRMFTERDHIHTCLYRFEWEYRRDPDGVPGELTLDHRFPGLVSVFVDPAEGVSVEELGKWYREAHLPALAPGSPLASVLAFSPLPLLGAAPSDVPRAGSVERLLLLCFLDEEPTASFDSIFAKEGEAVAAAGKGQVVWVSPFVATDVGTDRYTDQLWSEGAS
ncbi:MAG: hypothetical protein WB565_04030 [Acidimicrobiales bacterium]